jgi:hypothetical protein
MVSMLRSAKEAARMLYTGSATVYNYAYAKNEHGVDVKQEYIVFKDIPCRLSYDRKAVNSQDTVGDEVQDITMFCDPEYDIPAGSKIVITQAGVTRKFKCSSPAAVYESHQEVELTVYRGRA